jgi:hypothetical protein
VWLALICLISLAVIASVKVITAPAGKSASKIDDPFDEVDVTPLAVGTDQLPAADVADRTLADKVLVRTLKNSSSIIKTSSRREGCSRRPEAFGVSLCGIARARAPS